MGEQEEINIFDDLHDPSAVRRKDLLPGWIKFLCWTFAILSTLAGLAGIVCLVLNINVYAYCYGIDATVTRSFPGILLTFIFCLKGIASIALLTESDPGIYLGLADGIIGIVLGLGSMFINSAAMFPPELLLLIPYVVKLYQIREKWVDDAYARKWISAHE